MRPHQPATRPRPGPGPGPGLGRPSSPPSRHLPAVIIAATILAGAVAALGMLASFHTVAAAMRPSFHGWAWSIPVTLDMSVASFSLLELALLRMALPHLLARLAVYAATGATVYLNTRGAAPVGEHTALVAHAAMPAVWVLYIELLRSAAAALTHREHGATEHPVLALLLAPATGLKAWRRSILTPAQPRPHAGPAALKMSTQQGHFHGSHLHEDTMRESPDIFRAASSAHDPTAHPSLAQDTTPTQLTATMSASSTSSRARIGKGRGLTGRPAVLDLAHRHPDMTCEQIATRLQLTSRTVRRHLRHR